MGNGGSPLIGYLVERRENIYDNFWSIAATTTANHTGVTVRGVWCGVLWCGVVWCGVVWCGVVWCVVVWCGVVWCGVVWCGVVWCGVVGCGFFFTLPLPPPFSFFPSPPLSFFLLPPSLPPPPGLKPSCEYIFRVFAQNDMGVGDAAILQLPIATKTTTGGLSFLSHLFNYFHSSYFFSSG